jgi:hypothetical protein
VGRHVNKVLESKTQEPIDEGGRDASWWYDNLWAYVGAHMPITEAVTPKTVEGWYRAQEEKAQATAARQQSSASRSSSH